MTAAPVTIDRQQPLAVAHAMMREYGVRHLPVLEQGDLVGVVSLRDLYLLESFHDVDPAHDRVDEAMSMDTYAVAPDAAVAVVAAHMAEHRLGCAVVMERGRVAGIFTATDAMRLLARLLHVRTRAATSARAEFA